MSDIIIRTSETGWLAKLADAYKNQISITLIDDANAGIDPANQSIFGMGKSANLSQREFYGACVACGMGAVGIGLLIAAFWDPEPTSKLALAVGGGITLVLTGGGSAFYVLTKQKPPKINVGKNGFEMSWS